MYMYMPRSIVHVGVPSSVSPCMGVSGEVVREVAMGGGGGGN